MDGERTRPGILVGPHGSRPRPTRHTEVLSRDVFPHFCNKNDCSVVACGCFFFALVSVR